MNLGLTGLVNNYDWSGLYQPYNVLNQNSGNSFHEVLTAVGLGYNGYTGYMPYALGQVSSLYGMGGGRAMTVLVPEELQQKMEANEDFAKEIAERYALGNGYSIRLDEEGRVKGINRADSEEQVAVTSASKSQEVQRRRWERVKQNSGHSHVFGSCMLDRRV